MKYLFILALTITSIFAQNALNPLIAKKTGILAWDDPNPIGSIAYYNVTISTTNRSGVFSPSTNRFAITNAVWEWPNGVYTVTVTAVNKSEVESEPSDTLYFYWYGRPVKQGRPTLTVLAKGEMPPPPPSPDFPR